MSRVETLRTLMERDRALGEILKGKEFHDLYDGLGHRALASELIQLLSDLHREVNSEGGYINLLTMAPKLVIGTEPADMPELKCIGVATSLSLEDSELEAYSVSEGGINRMLYIDQHWSPMIMWDVIEIPGSGSKK